MLVNHPQDHRNQSVLYIRSENQLLLKITKTEIFENMLAPLMIYSYILCPRSHIAIDQMWIKVQLNIWIVSCIKTMHSAILVVPHVGPGACVSSSSERWVEEVLPLAPGRSVEPGRPDAHRTEPPRLHFLQSQELRSRQSKHFVQKVSSSLKIFMTLICTSVQLF